MIEVTKSLCLVEDLDLGFGATTQTSRSGTKISAYSLPYTSTLSTGVALDDRYTKSESDIRYAYKGGSNTQLFQVADGINNSDAVSFQQLESKALLNGSDLNTFNVADDIALTHAVNRQRLNEDLALKSDVTYVNSQLAAKAGVNGSSAILFDVAEATSAYNAVNKGLMDSLLSLKEDTTSVDNKLALKATTDEVDLKAYSSDVLELANDVPYNPTADYNPATKRYVDDSVANAFIFGASGSFTSADNKVITVTNGLITGIV